MVLEACRVNRPGGSNKLELIGPIPKYSGGRRVFNTPEFGVGNAIARHGEHGTWWSFEFPIKGYLLMEGENTISITQVRSFSEFFGVMYDYIRMEGPRGSWRDPTQLS
jgi:rhamnogalacturonan endolyase